MHSKMQTKELNITQAKRRVAATPLERNIEDHLIRSHAQKTCTSEINTQVDGHAPLSRV